MKKQAGFTLIELVMVIVILGILAAFALPRFADLGSQARIAVLDGAIGSVKSAAAIAHSAWLATGKATPVDLDGTSVTMSAEGYPTADAAGIVAAAQLDSNFAISGSTITVAGLTNCQFDYDTTTGQITNRVDSGCQ